MATTKTIQSVERAFSILEYLQQCGGGERSVKEIADALELNKSTAFGLINTLTTLGYLQQNADNLRRQRYVSCPAAGGLRPGGAAVRHRQSPQRGAAVCRRQCPLYVGAGGQEGPLPGGGYLHPHPGAYLGEMTKHPPILCVKI